MEIVIGIVIGLAIGFFVGKLMEAKKDGRGENSAHSKGSGAGGKH